jgi:hypothetical protein
VCNIGIGQLGDAPDRLLQAAQYLEEHEHAHEWRNLPEVRKLRARREEPLQAVSRTRSSRAYARDPDARAKSRSAWRAWRKANSEKEAAANRRKTYGLSAEAFDALVTAQRGRCAICRVSDATSVDHCHASGRIRAVLCRACNAGLGLFRDDARRMRAAAAYQRR